MDVLPAHAVTPTDHRSSTRRITGAAPASSPDRDIATLDALDPEQRLQLLAAAARMALCSGDSQ